MTPEDQPQPINPQALYRAHECARLFGIGLSTWWRWSSSGKARRGARLAPRIVVWEGAYLLELRQRLLAAAEEK